MTKIIFKFSKAKRKHDLNSLFISFIVQLRNTIQKKRNKVRIQKIDFTNKSLKNTLRVQHPEFP